MLGFLLHLWVSALALPSHGGHLQESTRASAEAPEFCREQDIAIPADTVLSLIRHFEREDGRIYVTARTYAVFSFFALPGFEGKEAFDLNEQCIAHFTPAPVDVAGARERGANVSVYDASACGRDEEDAFWIELSPLVRHPVSGKWGLFVRVSRMPCIPIGAQNYWAEVESRERPIITRLVRLSLIEH